MKENGSIFGEKTPAQQAAIERLKGDIEAIRAEANRRGKTIERYLLGKGEDPRTAYEIYKMAKDLPIIEPAGETEKVATKQPSKRRLPSFNEFFLDVIKWSLIPIIAGAVFYVVCPKYDFTNRGGVLLFRCNKITGYVSEGIWHEDEGGK